MCAITRTATSVLIEDPLFGWVCYGGNLSRDTEGRFELWPDDGVRQDMWIISDKSRVHLNLNRDNWSKESPAVIDITRRTANLKVTNGHTGEHLTELSVESIDCKAVVIVSGKRVKPIRQTAYSTVYPLHMNGNETTVVIKW